MDIAMDRSGKAGGTRPTAQVQEQEARGEGKALRPGERRHRGRGREVGCGEVEQAKTTRPNRGPFTAPRLTNWGTQSTRIAMTENNSTTVVKQIRHFRISNVTVSIEESATKNFGNGNSGYTSNLQCTLTRRALRNRRAWIDAGASAFTSPRGKPSSAARWPRNLRAMSAQELPDTVAGLSSGVPLKSARCLHDGTPITKRRKTRVGDDTRRHRSVQPERFSPAGSVGDGRDHVRRRDPWAFLDAERAICSVCKILGHPGESTVALSEEECPVVILVNIEFVHCQIIWPASIMGLKLVLPDVREHVPPFRPLGSAL